MLSLNCHGIATIQSFDPATQTVVATMNYLKSFENPNSSNGYFTMKYPIIVDCPVFILQGGGSGITFPIQAGDTCLILFNDREIDTWFSTGQVRAPGIQRFHSFSDGIALIGLRPATNAFAEYDDENLSAFGPDGLTFMKLGADGASLLNGEDKSTEVTVKETTIKIANADQSLYDVIKGLSDITQSLTTAIVVSSGISAIDKAAITAQITAFNLLLAELLE